MPEALTRREQLITDKNHKYPFGGSHNAFNRMDKDGCTVSARLEQAGRDTTYCDTCNRKGDEFYFHNNQGRLSPARRLLADVDSRGSMIDFSQKTLLHRVFQLHDQEAALREELSNAICSGLMIDQIVWGVSLLMERMRRGDANDLIGEAAL